MGQPCGIEVLMRWLLDTNVVIDTFAGRPEAIKIVTSARASDLEWIGYSAITRLEVLGFPGLAAVDKAGLGRLLAQFSEAEISAAIIERAIEIRRSLRIKVPDAIIVATALVYGASLVTRNVRDFAGVPDLTVVDPVSL
jgi:predicted nucleic acid-binding protein